MLLGCVLLLLADNLNPGGAVGGATFAPPLVVRRYGGERAGGRGTLGRLEQVGQVGARAGTAGRVQVHVDGGSAGVVQNFVVLPVTDW